MKTLLLPGNSIENKPWIREIAESFSDSFDEVITHEYDHWEKELPAMNFELELERLKNKVSETDEYVIFAKSAGCILALLAIQQGIVKSSCIVFVAIPFNWSRAEQYPIAKYLQKPPTQILFITKEKDPLCQYKDLEQYLLDNKVNNYKLELYDVAGEPNDIHHYADTEMLKKW